MNERWTLTIVEKINWSIHVNWIRQKKFDNYILIFYKNKKRIRNIMFTNILFNSRNFDLNSIQYSLNNNYSMFEHVHRFLKNRRKKTYSSINYNHGTIFIMFVISLCYTTTDVCDSVWKPLLVNAMQPILARISISFWLRWNRLQAVLFSRTFGS